MIRLKLKDLEKFKILNRGMNQIGLPPDNFEFRGKKQMKEVEFEIINFTDKECDVIETKDISTLKSLSNSDTLTWINIYGVHDTNVMAKLEDLFKLNRHILVDCMDTTSRPKLEEYENCMFLSIKMIQRITESNESIMEHLSFIILDSVVIVFQEKKGDVFDPIRSRINKNYNRFFERGRAYLTYTLLDVIIDNYMYVLSSFEEEIDKAEETIHNRSDDHIIEEIYLLKRKLRALRRDMLPARDLLMAASKLENQFIDEDVGIYYSNLHSNIRQVSEATESYRDILTELHNIYHTSLSSRLNDIIKFLTIFSVVFIPLTFIAGIYGTNFDVLPELHFKYSYWIMWGVMIIIASGMLFYFKKKKWF